MPGAEPKAKSTVGTGPEDGVQRGPGVGEARYLGVREYARLLGVSTATVYKAVARGEIAHVRVSSVIRILVGPAG